MEEKAAGASVDGDEENSYQGLWYSSEKQKTTPEVIVYGDKGEADGGFRRCRS